METRRHPVMDFCIQADNIAKEYNHRVIFQGMSFSLNAPASLAVTGKNGAGKSTFSKILAGLLSPSRGSLSILQGKEPLSRASFRREIGFVSPYLNFYDEFSAMENLRFLSQIRGTSVPDEEHLHGLFGSADLWQRRDDRIGTFSSGMKQRLKYIFALLHTPRILVLDEPTNSLDDAGKEFAKQVIDRQRKQGILVIATSDTREARWCSRKICLGRKG